MLHHVIKCAAKDVKFADLVEVRHSINLVLLATDGSEPAVHATQYAILLARLLGAKVHAIYVNTGLEDLVVPAVCRLDDFPEGLDPSVRGLLVARELSRINGIDCSIEVVRGGVASHIVNAAENEGAGLIVLGDTGRTGLKRIALGSVAESVVKASAIPVMVIKAS